MTRSRTFATGFATLALIATAAPATAAAGGTIGGSGSGDPYFPRQGNGGYDARHYSLSIGYTPSSKRLTGRALITARATHALTRFDLDLRRNLHVSSVRVNGHNARFAQPKSKVQELVITPRHTLRKGHTFRVDVRYAGTAKYVTDPDGSADGFIPTDDGAFVASEPQGSPTWFPVNDTPRDKATYSVSVTVPKGLVAVSNGALLHHRTKHGRTTWAWRLRQPVSSYLVTATIGKFDITTGRTPRGVPYFIAVDPREKAKADPVLKKLPAIVDFYSSVYGRYPFGQAGAIVDDAPSVGYALETATRPVFDRAPDELTLAHELAHQWFGDTVTVAKWRDIWLNEGFAQFSDEYWDEHTGGTTTAGYLHDLLTKPASDTSEWAPPPGNPGSGKGIFANSVYDRGAGALAALRQTLGSDHTFFAILRGWVAKHRYGNARVGQFIAYAEKISHRDLTHFFHEWLYKNGKPGLSGASVQSGGVPVESLFPALEPLLPRVGKPIQYVGGELNSRSKDWDSVTVRWALMYPDAYEVGLPNQGVQILYEVLNERDDALAERTYAVWPDLEALMREHGISQFTVDAHRPVGAFDLLGVSFSTELGYTNLLTALDLAGIPLHAADRDESHPIVVAGGHAAFNPEPIADFVDIAVLGDGEQAVGTITEIVRTWKDEGRPGGRDEVLLRLAATGGIYVPRFYDVGYLPDGRIEAVTPNRDGVPVRVTKHTVMDLDAWPYPKTPLVPLAESVHERMSVEIFRGCTRGCRFCQAGMITRPVRERSIDGIGEMVRNGLAASGFDEVGLLSLSSADHSEIGPLAKQLADRYEDEKVSLSLPSTRVDAFNIDLANEFSRNGRRSGLTFAPEGGSERLRRVINKMVSKDDLIRTVSTAYGQGWRQVKLYFMCGLPTETDDDVLEIAEMAHDVIRAGREAAGHKDIRCTVSIGGFVPKPHTPFQWAAQASPEVVDTRLRKLREAINANRSLGRNVGMRYHDGEPSLVEGLLSRGDRRVGAVIEQVWRDGGRFDGWTEHFSFARWVAACEATATDLAWYTTREREGDEVLPWDHLDSGLDKQWLWDDWQDALGEFEQDDCRWTPCFDCGVCSNLGTDIQIGPTGRSLLPLVTK